MKSVLRSAKLEDTTGCGKVGICAGTLVSQFSVSARYDRLARFDRGSQPFCVLDSTCHAHNFSILAKYQCTYQSIQFDSRPGMHTPVIALGHWLRLNEAG